MDEVIPFSTRQLNSKTRNVLQKGVCLRDSDFVVAQRLGRAALTVIVTCPGLPVPRKLAEHLGQRQKGFTSLTMQLHAAMQRSAVSAQTPG